MDARRHELFIKQGASDRYGSKEERDKQVEKDIRALERQIRQEEDSTARLQKELEQEQHEHDTLRSELAVRTLAARLIA